MSTVSMFHLVYWSFFNSLIYNKCVKRENYYPIELAKVIMPYPCTHSHTLLSLFFSILINDHGYRDATIGSYLIYL